MFDTNATDRKIYVPASNDASIINAYKAADYWKDYADYIEEYDFTEQQYLKNNTGVCRVAYACIVSLYGSSY